MKTHSGFAFLLAIAIGTCCKVYRVYIRRLKYQFGFKQSVYRRKNYQIILHFVYFLKRIILIKWRVYLINLCVARNMFILNGYIDGKKSNNLTPLCLFLLRIKCTTFSHKSI